jgi:penicillin G amidase
LAARTANAYGFARLALRLAWGGLRQRPRPLGAAARLASLPRRGLPVGAPVAIRWDAHLVPFIEAAGDRDLAIALGLVHAHLRLAQMELLRRLAQGRLAEVAGPLAAPLDHALRLLDPARAVPSIQAALPEPTRDWLDGFVAGINHHLASDAAPPDEFRLLGIAAARWTVAEVLTVARLAAADVNWLLWARLLPHRDDPEWPAAWARLIADGTVAVAGAAAPDAGGVAGLVAGSGRAGSNAVAVAGRRSASGRPWLAGDPHLALGLPSVWLAAAYRSPSYNVAGLMLPGIPVMAIGRNPYLAWGGTNLHAASSELFDVSALPPGEITERRVRLRVRWSGPREIVLRDTRYGPIVSDLPAFRGRPGETLALRWMGHAPSDEITALLAMNRARDIARFRRAAEGFAVPGQNLVVAERGGRIGRMIAAWLPRRRPEPPDDLVSPPAAATAWLGRATAADFPAEIDPPRGFVVSANERPPPAAVPVGRFFSPPDRAERMAALLRGCERIGLAELAQLQADSDMPRLLQLRDRLSALLVPPPPNCPVFAAFAGWDGRYEADSPGALAFELVTARLVVGAVPPPRRRLYGAVWHGRRLLTEEVEGLPPEDLDAALRDAFTKARPAFRRFGTWGGAHRLCLAHPFGRLPGLGRRWRHLDWPWPGSGETLLKSAHGLVTGRHAVSYGSNARYVFDLSDPDGNYLAILGGQDGAPESAAFLDQALLFRRGEYLAVPLDPATARARFPHTTLLEG